MLRYLYQQWRNGDVGLKGGGLLIIDSHIHYDPEVLTLERMLACMEEKGIDKAALIATMVEPFYLNGWVKPTSVGVLRQALLRANPLGRFIYETTVDRKGNFVLLGRKYHIYEKPDNAPVAEAIDKYPDKFVGWIFVNPAAGEDALTELEKWGSHPGMVGVKAHPFWHRYPVGQLEQVASWCREHGYPLLIHLGSKGGCGDYRMLPEKFPGLKIIYAHAGIPYFRGLWAYVRDREDVYIDLSSPYLDRKLAREAVDFLGAGKCLYGTDGPYGEQAPGEDYDYGLIKGWIEDLPQSDRELERIFSDNFQSIMKS
jgi:predicted TIM-barrel fold metal-dependent hydrolase